MSLYYQDDHATLYHGDSLEAARQVGCRAVGIEQDERWCEHAANRLSRLEFEAAA